MFVLPTLPAAAQGFHVKDLEAMAPLVGKTWVGEDVSATGERTVTVESWEWILGGNAVRVTQSVNNGQLGMQYTYFIDPTTHSIRFHAASNLGPYSKGTVAVKNGKMIRYEKVVGSPPVSDVKLTFSILADGTIKSSSEYFTGQKRIQGGHDFHYHADPDAKVIFK
jgi:hypothetical protein